MNGGSPPRDVALDINPRWLKSVYHKADMSLHRKPPAEPSIFRVPPSMRCGKPHDYEPKLVSIGPYHHRKSMHLQAMEELKWRLVHHYLTKIPNGRENEDLRKMKDFEERARNSYSEVINLDSDRFMEMLLLDGCFLVQIFITLHGSQEEASEEIRRQAAPELKSLLYGNMWFPPLIIRDMLLLENQLPYFIVEHLLHALGMETSILRRVAISSFIGVLPQPLNVSDPGQDEQVFQGADHLLDLFHRWILSSRRTEASETRSINKNSDKNSVTVPTMTELAEAGVKIEVRKKVSFLAISFSKDKGVLKIPDIYVDDDTSFLFANLIAFEQCCRTAKMDITHYAVFLDGIINTPKDVELLHQQGIIHRCLGSDEDIASLFNGLGNGVAFSPGKNNYLHEVCNDLNAYCQAKWPRFRAKAVHYYFNSPWAFLSSAAAALLIVLTILQTIYAIIGYYKDSDKPK